MAELGSNARLQSAANFATIVAVLCAIGFGGFEVWAHYHPYTPPPKPTTETNRAVLVPTPRPQPQLPNIESSTGRSVNWPVIGVISGLIFAGVLQLAAAVIRGRSSGSRSAFEAIKSAFRVRTLGVYVPQTRLDECVSELQQRTNERESIRGQLGRAEQVIAECRREVAFASLGLLAWRDLRGQPTKNVTVRYLEFTDNGLAEHVASTLRLATAWPTTVQRDATSHLAQETPNRVAFGSGDPEIVKRLANLFNVGNLIGEPVSPYEIIDRQSDDSSVLITIFPKVRA